MAQRWGGIVREGPGARAEAARYAWVDVESGERLVLEVLGNREFLDSLEELGFERLEEEPPGPAECDWRSLSA